ncbi:MAG: RHS repeat-associated core domain-containing protein [Opitutaceae bacterium]|nr:RHS repeat-associated core domain-containing protein [Opitutaceae bacterium]
MNLGYRYDEANRLAYVDDACTGAVRTTGYTYNPNGSLEMATAPNGVKHAYAYDTLNRLRTLSVSNLQSQIVHSYTYSLTPSGHRRQVIEGAKTTTYAYDDLYRLTSETVAGVADPGQNGMISYTLDKVGNRLARSSAVAPVPSVLSQTYDARDRLTGLDGRSVGYDLNGNTTSGSLQDLAAAGFGTFTDVYDFENRLVLRTKADGSSINIVYDADGNRIGKTSLDSSSQLVVSTSYLVDANNLTGYSQVMEERIATAAGTETRIYSYGTDLIGQDRFDPAAGQWKFSFVGRDGHGSIRELLDETGSVTDTFAFDAWGLLVARAGVTPNHYLCAGEQFDEDLGLYFNRARYLNVQTGRFWTMDDYEGAPADPVSLHKYLYASANPVSFMDPTGHFSMVELQQAMFTVSTLARIALPNIARLGVGVAQRMAASLLRPFFALAGGIPLATQMGQRLSAWDKFQRFFITPTQSYPGVANWLRELFQRMGVTLNQHHVFIQQAWYRAGSPSQWYPGDTAANLGMQRLGNAGFNLLAIPDGLNRAMGAATVAGSAKTAAFATATAGSVAMAMEYVWDMISSPFEDEQPTPTPPPPPNP